MADNLTLRLKRELERRHNRVVSEEEINTFLQSQGLSDSPSSPKPFQAPTQSQVPDWFTSQQRQEQVSEAKGGMLNALGVGLWTAADTALFGIPGAFVEEEQYLDFEDTAGKYTGALGGLLGFIGGAPMKIGAKILQVPAKAAIRSFGYESLESVSKQMLKKGVAKGAPEAETKTLVSAYKKLAHKAQTDADIRENFSRKSIDLVTRFTDDAVNAGRLSPSESVALKELFEGNVLQRPLQDFIGLMGTRGFASSNPRLARVLGHAVNDSIMFGAIDTIFEGVSMIEDGSFDWTAPAWGVATGLAFSQISWLDPVGKGSKWFPDMMQGVRAAFSKKVDYTKMSNKHMAGTGKFFGESLERIKPNGAIVTLEHQGRRVSGIDLESDNLLQIVGDRFGSHTEGRKALAKFFDASRKEMGKELIRLANREGYQNLALNWKRMMLGGVLFNTHTIADMAISGYEPDINDILPHFLIGAFLQLGKNPASFDLNSKRINQFRYNLSLLGFETKQLSQIPSLPNTPSRFDSPYKSDDPIVKEFERMGLGADVFETVDIRRPKGETSHYIKGNYTFEKIRDSLKEHFTYLKNPDDITVKEARDFVKFFKEKTGTKNLNEIETWLRQKGIDNTKSFENIFPDMVEQIRQVDAGQELAIDLAEDGKFRIQRRIHASEELIKRARDGELEWLGNLKGEDAVAELVKTLDGFAAISSSAMLLDYAKAKPGNAQVKEIKTEETARDIYKIIKEKELEIESQFPSKMSYSDRFSFLNNHADIHRIILTNLSLKNSETISKIFNRKFVERDGLIDVMIGSGLLTKDLTNPKLVDTLKNLRIGKENKKDVSEENKARNDEYKRVLRKILRLQKISNEGEYQTSKPSEDLIFVKPNDVERLINFLEDRGLPIRTMSESVMSSVENFIIREKIGNASLSVAEVNAFYELADIGLAEFRLDAKDKSGFLISPIDTKFVQNGFVPHAEEYNRQIKKIARRSAGLITETTPIKVVSGLEVNSILSLLPRSLDIRQSANQQLAEFINLLPTKNSYNQIIGQYVMEGGAPEVVSWLAKHGVLEYNKKSKGWKIQKDKNGRMIKFTEALESKLQEKIESESGLSPEYVENRYNTEMQIAKNAFGEHAKVETSTTFNFNNFFEKYLIDDVDVSAKSKDVKQEYAIDLILSRNAPMEDRVPAADILDNVLNRISVKVDKDFIKFKDLDRGLKSSYEKEIQGDILKLITSKYNSIRINNISYKEGRITEGESWQQNTRLNTLLQSLELPYAIIEREAIVWSEYGGKFQRKFVDIFSNSSDLPKYERDRIRDYKNRFDSLLNRTSDFFGSVIEDGLVIVQLSKDTAPIAIPRNSLSNIDKSFISLSKKLSNNENIRTEVRDRIKEVSNKMENPSEIGKPTDVDYKFALSHLVFADMMMGKNSINRYERFLNGEGINISKDMSRVKLYDSKNFVKHDRAIVRSMMNIYDRANDRRTYDALGKVMRQNGFNVAIWNDVDYSSIGKEVSRILKEDGYSDKRIQQILENQIGDVHSRVSSFDSIAFVSKSQIRYAHAMMGNNPNSTNPVKPAISSGGRDGQLLLGKTLFIYDKSLDGFFSKHDIDILLTSSGAKAFNQGKLSINAQGFEIDNSIINRPFNQINTIPKIGTQKIRNIPIDGIGFKAEIDKTFKSATESTADFNYMTNAEHDAMFNSGYQKQVRDAIKNMELLVDNPIRVRQFAIEAFGQQGIGLDPSQGSGKQLSAMMDFISMSRDANPMSYSENIVKNKMYNLFINTIINGQRSVIETEGGNVFRYGGQAPVIQSVDPTMRLKPTILGEDGKIERYGEIMIGEHERSSNINEIIKGNRDIIFVERGKTITPEKLFGKEEWDVIRQDRTLGMLHDFINGGFEKGKPRPDLQIGLITNRKPRTRPNDMAILGLKGFLPKSYGKSALVNSLDIVNIFEGDYDADKVDYFYGARKPMIDHAIKSGQYFVQGVDPSTLTIPTRFSWADSPTTIVGNIENMAANSELATKQIGVVQKVPRMLNNLSHIAQNITVKDGIVEDKALKRFEAREGELPQVLFYTKNSGTGELDRLVIDFNNKDFYQRAALETQYMIDMGGGANPELMTDIRNWKPRFLFPSIEESITPGEARKQGVGFINRAITQNKNDRRLRIFRKFDKDGKEIELSELDKAMIKEVMTEYGAFLNVIGNETYQKSGESRSITYNDVYNKLDSFYNFNSNMSNQLYTRLWGKFKKDKQFQLMFEPKEIKYEKYGKEKVFEKDTRDIFDDGVGTIKQNVKGISEGTRGGVVERTLNQVWQADVFQSNANKKYKSEPTVTGDLVRHLDNWYHQISGGTYELEGRAPHADYTQSLILKEVRDYNSGAYAVGKIKRDIIKTKNRNDLSYKQKQGLINYKNNLISDITKKMHGIPKKFFISGKTVDLRKYKIEPVEGKETIDAVVRHNTIESLIDFRGGLGGDTNRQSDVKDVIELRKLMYGSGDSLKDILDYGKTTLLTDATVRYLREINPEKGNYTVESELLLRGFNKYGVDFIIDFMRSPQDNFTLGVHNGRLVPMPYSKSSRYRRGLQFLTEASRAEKTRELFGIEKGITSEEVAAVKQLLGIIQVTESNFDRFYNKRFDMKDFTSEPDYSVRIGKGEDSFLFSLSNVRLPSFSKPIEDTIYDYNSIKWTRDTNRVSGGFDLINDASLSFYADIAEVSGRTAEFKDYLNIMNGLKMQMVQNKTIDPIEYLAIRSTIQNDMKQLVSDVLSGGIDINKQSVSYRRLRKNPMYILYGGDANGGDYRGVTLEKSRKYLQKELKEVVSMRKRLEQADETFGIKEETGRTKLKEFIKGCQEVS
jgi:hypothetical protein